VRKDRVQELSNSYLLSHWMFFMVEPNYVDTYEKKFDRVANVSNFKSNENVHK
jgi:hypothetical protein